VCTSDGSPVVMVRVAWIRWRRAVQPRKVVVESPLEGVKHVSGWSVTCSGHAVLDETSTASRPCATLNHRPWSIHT